MREMRAAITANNCAIGMVMDSLLSFSLHTTTEATDPYHCPNQVEYAAYVAWQANFGDQLVAAQGGGNKAAHEEAAHEDNNSKMDADSSLDEARSQGSIFLLLSFYCFQLF